MSGPHPLILADLSEGGYKGLRVLDAAVLCLADAEELLTLTITPATWAVLRTLGLEDATLQAQRLFDMIEGRRGRAHAQRKAQVAIPEPEHEFRRRERQVKSPPTTISSSPPTNTLSPMKVEHDILIA